MKKLTPKQERFIEEYLVDLNATAAAVRAGYSENRASEIGYQLLQKTTVSEAIQAGQAALADEAEFNQQSARQMYFDAYQVALEDRNPAAMNSSASALCKLFGLNDAELRAKNDVNPQDSMADSLAKYVELLDK